MINNTFQYLYFIMLYRIQCSLSKVQWEKHRGLFLTLLTDDEMIESSVVCTKTCSCKYDKWSLILRHLCGIRFFFLMNHLESLRTVPECHASDCVLGQGDYFQ